jgi:hypothetical protein
MTVRLIPGGKPGARVTDVAARLDLISAMFTALLGIVVAEQPDLRKKMLFALDAIRNAPEIPASERATYDEAITIVRAMVV